MQDPVLLYYKVSSDQKWKKNGGSQYPPYFDGVPI